MAKKRKTLPTDFEEIAKRGDLIELKSVFDKCEINAYGGFGKVNALSFDGIGEDFIRWAVAQGMDVNFPDTWGRLPILCQARSNPDNVRVLLELGADLEKGDTSQCTPLGNAVGHLIANENKYKNAVKCLVELGADINSPKGKFLPLEMALQRCVGMYIPMGAWVAQYLIDRGAKKTPNMKDSVRRIGENFEFHRSNFNEEFLPETDKALQQLYEIFEVEPVARRIIYDGKSPIIVKSTTVQDQLEELWEMLVPSSGHASTVQGEVVRISGKVRSEMHTNNGGNWNKNFKKLPQALPHYFVMGNTFDADDLNEAVRIAKSISLNSDDEDLDSMCEYAVKWVLLNPNPIALEKVDYNR